MRLELDRLDLKEEFKDVHCAATRFKHFRPEVQIAITAVGKATFYTNKGAKMENYNVVYPVSRGMWREHQS